MERVTVKQLRGIMGRMARNLGVDSSEPVWSRDAAGRDHARIGALVLNQGSATYDR